MPGMSGPEIVPSCVRRRYASTANYHALVARGESLRLRAFSVGADDFCKIACNNDPTRGSLRQ